jgi:glycosyltransferase involved in cell wall biosynthesis
MRIAVFTDTYFPQVNGVSKYLEQMQKYMGENGIDYQLFVPQKPIGMQMDQITSFYGLPFLLYPELRISWPSYARIKSVLDKFNPDIVYLATPLSIGIAGLKYARENGIPVVSTYHTHFPQYLRYYHLNYLQGAVWKYLKWFHSFCQINFCPSMETLEQLQQYGIDNLILCNNGIDCNTFSPDVRSATVREYYAPQGEVLLLYVGRIAPEKDLNILMHAAGLLNKAQVDYKLIIVGDGPSRKSLQEQGINNIIFTGYKSGRELQEFYASADIFVFPSPTETFGNVILEAMASGLPVVAAYAGGVKESLTDGYNGLTFAPGDANGMSHHILKLLIDTNLRQELAQNANSFALTRTWDKIFAGFFDNCGRIILGNQPSPQTASDKIA